MRTIREAAKISQSQFAKLIGVSLRRLKNWEQQRTQLRPARALLKIVASNPTAIEALHGQIWSVSGRAKSYAGRPARLRLGGAKDERVETAAVAAVEKAR